MIPDEKLIGIAERLLDKTKRGEANWKEVSEYGSRATKFRLPLPDSEVVLAKYSPDVEPDNFVFNLNGPRGRAMGSLYVTEGDPNWQLMTSLFNEIDRHTSGWDRVLAAVETELSKPGPIGVISEQETVAGDSHEVPF